MAKNLIMDISHHQISSAINWKKAAEEVALCIIRVQYGSKLIDREYKNHVANCKKYGIPFGHYAYGHFVSISDAEVEARDFLNRMDKDALFLALDTEKDTVSSCGTKDVAEASQAFIDVCKAAGHKVGFYVSHHLYKKHGLDKVKADFLWLPRYGKDNGQPDLKPDYPCDLWQYSQHCKVSWYPGGLDLNLLHGKKDLEWFIGEQSVKEVVKETPKTEVKSTSSKAKTYKVVKSVPAYKTAADAKTKRNKAGTVKAGTYSVFNESSGMINVTSKRGVPGSWINPAENKAKATSTAKYHKVVSGDVVSKLAIKYGSTISQIKAWNKLDSKYTIYVGTKIRVK